MKKLILGVAFIQLILSNASAQYNQCAGQSRIENEKVEKKSVDVNTGETVVTYDYVPVKAKDDYGNVKGNQFDLAVDGAFEGQTIVVLQLYSFGFEAPTAALKEKGFSIYRMQGVPSPKELQEALDKSCQFWLISGSSRMLSDEHAEIIKSYFYSGKGVYIWGDNSPYHADADFISEKLLGITMSGTYMGDQAVGFKTGKSTFGLRENHLITTGLETVYEGITISQIHDKEQKMTPLIWSTDGNVVTAVYEDQGMRLIIDGGFTRLYNKWESAGTDRYIKNAAAWLVNYERFGESVVGLKK